MFINDLYFQSATAVVTNCVSFIYSFIYIYRELVEPLEPPGCLLAHASIATYVV